MVDFNAKRYFLDEITKRNLSEEDEMNSMFERAIELSGRSYKQLFEVYRAQTHTTTRVEGMETLANLHGWFTQSMENLIGQILT